MLSWRRRLHPKTSLQRKKHIPTHYPENSFQGRILCIRLLQRSSKCQKYKPHTYSPRLTWWSSRGCTECMLSSRLRRRSLTGTGCRMTTLWSRKTFQHRTPRNKMNCWPQLRLSTFQRRSECTSLHQGQKIRSLFHTTCTRLCPLRRFPSGMCPGHTARTQTGSPTHCTLATAARRSHLDTKG